MKAIHACDWKVTALLDPTEGLTATGRDLPLEVAPLSVFFGALRTRVSFHSSPIIPL